VLGACGRGRPTAERTLFEVLAKRNRGKGEVMGGKENGFIGGIMGCECRLKKRV
jgi:hypothetical protein